MMSPTKNHNPNLKISNSSLVSNKKLNQKIPSSSWGPGPGNLSQNSLKPSQHPLMTSPTKNPKFKTFQFFSLQSRRLATSFERLNSSLEKSPG